jgi:hypothetical protein
MILLGVLLASPAAAQTLTVPLNIDGPQIFVSVLVNDKHARLLLDTGAGITLIEPQFANGTTELKRVSIEQQTGMSHAPIRLLSITLGETDAQRAGRRSARPSSGVSEELFRERPAIYDAEADQ